MQKFVSATSEDYEMENDFIVQYTHFKDEVRLYGARLKRRCSAPELDAMLSSVESMSSKLMRTYKEISQFSIPCNETRRRMDNSTKAFTQIVNVLKKRYAEVEGAAVIEKTAAESSVIEKTAEEPLVVRKVNEEAVLEEVKERPLCLKPKVIEFTHFVEPFENDEKLKKELFSSDMEKDGAEKTSSECECKKELVEAETITLQDDLSLVSKSRAEHHAITSKLQQVFDFSGRPLISECEIEFQNGMQCGGAYMKLLTKVELDLAQFHNKIPYTIMSSPDKCGLDYKLHFRHKNMKTGEITVKHAQKPMESIEKYFIVGKPPLYQLAIIPDNTFKINIDGHVVNIRILLGNKTSLLDPPEEKTAQSQEKVVSSWIHRKNLNTVPVEITYVPSHRNPLYCRAETTPLWELQRLSFHYHPTVSLYASTLLSGKFVEFDGDPLQDYTLMRFLDRFVFKNPKKIEKLTDTSVPKKRQYKPTGIKLVPANSSKYLEDEASIPVEEKYLYRYFAQKDAVNRQKGIFSDDEEVDDDEFDEFIENYEGMNKDYELDDFDFYHELSKQTGKKKNKDVELSSESEAEDVDDGSDEDVDFGDDFMSEFKDLEDDDDDEKVKIPHSNILKPNDRDENESEKIIYPDAGKPDSRLNNEPENVHEPDAERPSDWADMNEKWEAPFITECNPAPAYGQWNPGMIDNPKYMDKWKPHVIDNPNYQVAWKLEIEIHAIVNEFSAVAKEMCTLNTFAYRIYAMPALKLTGRIGRR